MKSERLQLPGSRIPICHIDMLFAIGTLYAERYVSLANVRQANQYAEA